MQIHLLDCKSSSPSISHVGNHRLELCIAFQAELKDTYWGANQAFRIFRQAQKKLSKTAYREGERATLATSKSVAVSEPIDAFTPTCNDFNQSETIPSVDDILTFDFDFTEPQDFSLYGVDYS